MSTPASSSPVSYDLVVSLGTDYHHFDRLVDWVEAFLKENPEVTCLFQHGFTRKPQGVEAVERMPRAELLEHYERAKVVLVQGGPGSILDAREVGVIPFAVPRLKEFDEVVDNHQVQFSKVMESRGETVIVKDATDLAEKLNSALAHPETVHGSRRVSESDAASENLQDALENMYAFPVDKRGRFTRRFGHVAKSFFAKQKYV